MKTIEVKVTIGDDGRLLVDSPVNLPSGKYNAVLVLEDKPIQPQAAGSLSNAQALFRQYVPADRKLSEELIQERRTEALDEYTTGS